MDGYLGILKLPGVTSHNVVKEVRKLLSVYKVGHGGTLDPGAAGVLPVLVGKGTRFSSFIMDSPKTYRAEITLGLATDTGDSFGEPTGKKEVKQGTLEILEDSLERFKGEIEQLPPMASAVKHKGKKLYQYARQGQEIERKPRKVHIYSLNIIASFPPDRALLEICCSKGTYIRSLCLDLGEIIGCGAHMSFLLRKESGGFTLGDSVTMEEIKLRHEENQIEKLLHPLDHPFKEYDSLVLDLKLVSKLCHGQVLAKKDLPGGIVKKIMAQTEKTLFPVYSDQGEFFLLASSKKDRQDIQLKPEKVIKQPGS